MRDPWRRVVLVADAGACESMMVKQLGNARLDTDVWLE